MIDVIKITNIEEFTEKKLIKSSTQKKILKDFCVEDCKIIYDAVPRRTRFGFMYVNDEYDIIVYYIFRQKIKGKTIY